VGTFLLFVGIKNKMNRRPPGLFILPALAGLLTTFYAWRPIIEEKQTGVIVEPQTTPTPAPRKPKTIPSTRVVNQEPQEEQQPIKIDDDEEK